MIEDTAEFELHRRIARALESGVVNRDWWIWISFRVDAETAVSLAGLAETVERWLGEADPDEELGQHARVRELTWPGGGIHVTLRAIPRRLASRGAVELVGNPFPAIAYWTGGS